MPPQQRARKTTSAEDTAADQSVPEAATTPDPVPEQTAAAESEAGPICAECFPGGWDARPDAVTVGCEHGTYTR